MAELAQTLPSFTSNKRTLQSLPTLNSAEADNDMTLRALLLCCQVATTCSKARHTTGLLPLPLMLLRMRTTPL
jgi:hypothetical protein